MRDSEAIIIVQSDKFHNLLDGCAFFRLNRRTRAGLRPANISTINLMLSAKSIPESLSQSSASGECSLHQLSPYIGKLKSSIARHLILTYSKRGDVIIDPFSGSGTVPLEALLTGRVAFASDTSHYAALLSKAKMHPPESEDVALARARQLMVEALDLPAPDLRSVPKWVRNFFHPKTLKEILRFARIVQREGNEFWFACLLGILHHQRPGFLSFPSSHLVPYLRDRKYPREHFPEMYEYRALAPRLEAKIRRVFKRSVRHSRNGTFVEGSADKVVLPKAHAIITSPPYMNALDYERDNRLRLWFIEPATPRFVEQSVSQKRQSFIDVITTVVKRGADCLKPCGHFILVIGEEVQRTFRAKPSDIVRDIIGNSTPELHLREVYSDQIPDIRRGRRNCRGIKQESILVYRKRARNV